MTFEEFEKAKKTDLQKAAKDCFEKANAFGESWDGKAPYLLEAQFYMAELDRRSSGWIATRDLVLELVVILLIGWEIFEGNKQATVLDKQLTVLNTIQTNAATQAERDKVLMDKQNTILSDLQTATSSTATTMKNLDTSSAATARTLLALQSTMEQMSKASQGQLELFYDVSLNVIWDTPTKRLIMTNNGRTNVSFLGYKVFEYAPTDWKEQIITPTGQYFVIISPVEKMIETVTKAGKDPLNVTWVPMQLYVKNAKGEEFALEINMIFLWEGEHVVVRTQTLSITPQKRTRPGNATPPKR